MGGISTLKRYFNKCRVFHTPTSLAGDPPYGGVELGACKRIQVHTGVAARVITDYITGQAIEVISTKRDPRIDLVFRQWDDDALALVFPSTTGTPGILYQSSANGLPGSSRAKKILLASTDTQGLFCLFQRAIPNEEETAFFNMTLDEELTIGAVFYAAEPTAGATPAIQIGYVGDITI